MTLTERRAGQRLCQRLVAIRAAAVKPARDFNLQWQLGLLLEEMERAFGIRSSQLDSLVKKRCYGCRSPWKIDSMSPCADGKHYMCPACDRLGKNMCGGL